MPDLCSFTASTESAETLLVIVLALSYTSAITGKISSIFLRYLSSISANTVMSSFTIPLLVNSFFCFIKMYATLTETSAARLGLLHRLVSTIYMESSRIFWKHIIAI
ncbi:unnamed protein product [Lepeophtheirus salmonis]|uniref:(salmon louse) hypothetical protein n=1 Tax=Lepeophtheirus salmonis TaxID=72036 RepID=A0A7R8CLY4_LEPSM|nr:unnamed protein product [Lepeophtheirus salmonis]CAF2861709.1 unnamed protein product [Lepeophtheirus salmonis]